MQVPPDRWVEAKTNQGWGIAALVIALAAACIVAATVIHQRTYRHPTDPSWQAIQSAKPAH